MPLARVDIPKRRAPEFRVAVGDVVYAAMTATLDVPIGDRFQVICEHEGSHQMPGIGVDFIPQVLNRTIIDEVIAVSDDEAFACARRLAREERILAGVASGAALHAALTFVVRPQCAGKPFVVIICDTGERYVSSALFATQ
jgi:cysteine synthase